MLRCIALILKNMNRLPCFEQLKTLLSGSGLCCLFYDTGSCLPSAAAYLQKTSPSGGLPNRCPDWFTEITRRLQQHGYCESECLILTDSDAVLSSLSFDSGRPTGFTLLGLTVSFEPGQSLSGAYALLESFDSIDLPYFRRIHAHKHHEPAEIAVTNRLILRELSLPDFEELYRIRCLPEVTPFLEEIPGNIETERTKFQSYLSTVYPFCDFALWGIFDRSFGRLLGQVGFSLREGEASLSFGYLLDPKYRHQGYATEAVRAALTYAKEQGLSDTLVHILPQNTASQKVLSACGFPFEQLSSDRKLLTYRIILDKCIASNDVQNI